MRSRLAICVTLGSTQTLAWASSYYLPAVFAVPMARDTGLAPTWIYAALSAGLGISAILGPFVGREIDRLGGRPVLCGSNVAFAAGLGLVALARGPVSLLVAWLVMGVAMAAGLYEAAFASLTRFYGDDSRSAITGITLIAGFASTVGWPTSALLEHAFGWRGACVIWAALHLMLGLPFNAWALRDVGRRHGRGRGDTRADSPEARVPSSGRDLASDRGRSSNVDASPDRGVLLLSLMFTVSGMVSIGMSTNLPRLFSMFGASPAAAIAAASILGPAQVVARIVEFSARRRINPLISARIASALHPLASLTLAIGGAPVIAAFSIIHGAGNGMLTICRGTLPLALYGPDGYGERIGRIATPARIGQATAPFLFGLAIDKLGGASLLISSGLSLAALFALSRIELPTVAIAKAG